MNRKGVLYDVGRVLGVNWRSRFDPTIVHRELSILKNHCRAGAFRAPTLGSTTSSILLWC
jgi:hypothetical protein